MLAQDDLERMRNALLGSEAKVPTSALRRLWGAGKGALGVTRALARSQRGEEVDPEDLAGLVRALGQLKGIAMKAGQMLGYVNASVPDELRSAMALLQTASPAMPFEQIVEVITSSLGTRAPALLDGIERAPIAVASIAQVHRAMLPDGTHVAIKVRHPNVEQAVEADFRSAAIGRVLAGIAGAYGVRDMIVEARTAFLEECDFELEATRQERFARLFADDPVIRIPSVIRAYSTRSVLVTRWTPGRSFDEFLATDPPQASRDVVGEALFRFWMRTLYREGLFHADPHPGNFAFRDDGSVVIYDFGCVRELDPQLRRGFAALAAATRDDDVDAMSPALDALGGRAPTDHKGKERLRRLLRGFYGPLLATGPRRIALDEGFDARQVMADKRAIARLQLPARMLFLFRLRFGLYAVLARLGAEVDWSALEQTWARETA